MYGIKKSRSRGCFSFCASLRQADYVKDDAVDGQWDGQAGYDEARPVLVLQKSSGVARQYLRQYYFLSNLFLIFGCFLCFCLWLSACCSSHLAFCVLLLVSCCLLFAFCLSLWLVAFCFCFLLVAFCLVLLFSCFQRFLYCFLLLLSAFFLLFFAAGDLLSVICFLLLASCFSLIALSFPIAAICDFCVFASCLLLCFCLALGLFHNVSQCFIIFPYVHNVHQVSAVAIFVHYFHHFSIFS